MAGSPGRRITGLPASVGLGLDFYGATPSNTVYPSDIYTIEYDGFADFPRYLIDFLSDLNAFAGIATVHQRYPSLAFARIDKAITLPTDPAYDTTTTHYMIPTHSLPLLDPLRAVPVVGKPLADLVQSDLRVLVNLGYGDPDFGYSTDPANVPTQFGLFPSVNPATVIGELATGTQHGIGAFARDISVTGFPSLPDISQVFTSNPSTTLDTPYRQRLITRATATAYSTLLPTADIANAVLTSVPSYDVNLFLDGISQAANSDHRGRHSPVRCGPIDRSRFQQTIGSRSERKRRARRRFWPRAPGRGRPPKLSGTRVKTADNRTNRRHTHAIALSWQDAGADDRRVRSVIGF
jgi:hypothetical protein